jgi:triphosphoribosyl-dephospho-CoA synthase
VFSKGQLVQTACVWEATARKVGNVHRYADFPNTGLVDFLLSAVAVGPLFDSEPTDNVGPTIRRAVTATREAVGQNTNLGIVLLLVPLATPARALSLRANVSQLLSETNIGDTREVFAAIRLANPGGLGTAPSNDVHDEPHLGLRHVMELAAHRDMIARQYANDFADVFDFGVRAFTDAFAKFGCVEAAIVDSQLRWLAAYPDSLIARKHGPAVAEEVRKWAADVLALGGIETAAGRTAGVALDKHLRSDGNKLNPGTTADLITACLFVALRENMVTPSAPFRWQVADWL